jgi:hypothetical protein
VGAHVETVPVSVAPAASSLVLGALALKSVLDAQRGEHGKCEIRCGFVRFNLEVPGGEFLRDLPEQRSAETRGGPLAFRPS